MLGTRIKERRTELGMSQLKLGEKLGLTQSLICYYELGTKKPSYEIMVALANELNCTTDYLLGRE